MAANGGHHDSQTLTEMQQTALTFARNRGMFFFHPHMTDESQPSSRRLSAIVFTDIVGYSALTQRNESLALRLLDAHNSLLRDIFREHHGTEIKSIGDAFLVEFLSALEAVECGVAIQRALMERNKIVQQEERLSVRIGVHVGDVIHTGSDVLGDGVNIAARIHTIAEPGGICVSEDVARQVRNKLSVPLREIGQRRLKNISTPVRLFDVLLPWQSTSWRRLMPHAVDPLRGMTGIAGVVILLVWLFTSWNPFGMTHSPNRIAVLPMRSLSENQEDAYFAEGLSEELVSSLSRISGLEVIASASVGRYREASMDFGAIGDQLKAGSLLEGSVRRWADTARVSVRLIDASSERLIWTEDFNRPFRDILNLQNEVAMRVAGALEVQLLETEKSDLLMNETKDHEAWRLYLLSRHHLSRRTSEDIEKSIFHAQQALTHDPAFAPTYASMAEAYTLIAAAGYGSIPRDIAVAEAERAARKALELNPRLAEAHAVYAYIQFRLQWKWHDADSLFRNAIALKPSYAKAHEWYGLYLGLIGKFEGGIREMQRAMDLDPNSASVGTGLGRLYSFNGQYDEAIGRLSTVLKEHPNYPEAYFALGLAHIYKGDMERGIRNLETAARLSDRRPVIIADLGFAYARTGRIDDARAILRELDSLSATNASVSPWIRSVVHLGLGDTTTALDLMEESFRLHDGLLVYLKAEPMAEIKNNPRFQALLKNIGFPEE